MAAVDSPTWEVGAGEGNRTLVFSLEGCCSTIELHPQSPPHWHGKIGPGKWRPWTAGVGGCSAGPPRRGQQKVVEGTGFEPVYAKRADLQSAGFNHSPTPPRDGR